MREGSRIHVVKERRGGMGPVTPARLNVFQLDRYGDTPEEVVRGAFPPREGAAWSPGMNILIAKMMISLPLSFLSFRSTLFPNSQHSFPHLHQSIPVMVSVYLQCCFHSVCILNSSSLCIPIRIRFM